MTKAKRNGASAAGGKMYVVSSRVWFGSPCHLFASGEDEEERTQQRPYVWRPKPGETETRRQLITAN